MTKEFRTTEVDVLNSRKAMKAISLNAKFKNLVTDVELCQATFLIVAQLKMSLAAHVKREAITQKSSDDGSSKDDVSVMTIGETVNMVENNSQWKTNLLILGNHNVKFKIDTGCVRMSQSFLKTSFVDAS